MKVNDIEMENDGLRKSVEKRQIKEEKVHKDMEDIRQKVPCHTTPFNTILYHTMPYHTIL
jgi:hypothetical protein